MSKKLTDKGITAITPPKIGMKFDWDSKVRGLGVRTLPSKTKSWVLRYNVPGSSKRPVYTLASCSDWNIAKARQEALELKAQIRKGTTNPAAELKARREAPTVDDLAKRYLQEHGPTLRASTLHDYEMLINNYILPALGTRLLSSLQHEDIDKLIAKITASGKKPTANYVASVCLAMFNKGIRWRLMTANPAKGVSRNPMHGRERFLNEEEIARLNIALAQHGNQDAADLIRTLLLTGCRRGEALGMRWDQIQGNEWCKPSSMTKQDRVHRLALSGPMLALLKRRASKNAHDTFVFPAKSGNSGHITELKRAWRNICKVAKLERVRIHDLRHSAASAMMMAGIPLTVVGSVLGHSQMATTQKYSHVGDRAQQAAVDKLGNLMTGQKTQVVPLKRSKK